MNIKNYSKISALNDKRIVFNMAMNEPKILSNITRTRFKKNEFADYLIFVPLKTSKK